MKIAQVIPFYAPAWGYGGPVKVCSQLSRELAKRKHKVTVITTDALDQISRVKRLSEKMDEVKVLRFRNISNRLAKKGNLFLPMGFAKYCKKNLSQFNLVHLHAFYTFLNIITYRSCLSLGVPYILHLHEKFDATSEMGKSFIKKIFLSLFGRQMLRGAKKIIVLSANEKTNLVKFDKSLANKIEILPNPAPKIRAIKLSKNNLRKQWGYRNSDKIILTLSRLSYLKGVDLLIKAFALLAKKDERWRLVIAGGDNGQQQTLEQLVKKEKITEKVKFTGEADQKIKDELFTLSDIFAMFSRYESFGIVVLESLSYSLVPCLSKKIGLGREVKKRHCGVVCNPTSSRGAAKALAKTYSSRHRLAKNSRVLLGEFSLGKVTDRLEKFYKQINAV